MNKAAIQRFAVWARKEMIAQVSQRAYQYGITAEGRSDPDAVTVAGRVLSAEEQSQRRELVKLIGQKGYSQVMEEMAYTWFNRFIALRYMEVNQYLPSHIRVFSDSTGAFKPEILSQAIHLELPGLDRAKVAELIEQNRTEDLYRYLLLTQCNALNEALPRMFEPLGGYTELLLPNNILKADGILGRMVTEIDEADWLDQIQTLGWAYQYYNSELKDDTFALLKKNVKITRERIPSATQLFTPDWIVRYMVENSLGRLWAEGHPHTQLKANWRYYLEEPEQEPGVQAQLEALRAEYAALKPQDIRIIDPCMGSGHILVYAFDLLMQIYESEGWSRRDAACSILEHNLYGLDIDDRAAQLAYFAVMMKARQYDRRIFSRGIQPHVYAVAESNGLDSGAVDYFTGGDPGLETALNTVLAELYDAKEYGSIVPVTPVDFDALNARLDAVRGDISIYRDMVLESIEPLIRAGEVMARQYHIVVTNPPYMGAGSMSAALNRYVRERYPNSKSDLFAVFMERCGQMTGRNGYLSMITQHAWMFLASYEALRQDVLGRNLISMAHLGAKAFEEIGGEVVQATAFVVRNSPVADYKAVFKRLVAAGGQSEKERAFLSAGNTYTSKTNTYSAIPGTPVAYWWSSRVLEGFGDKQFIPGRIMKGIQTGNGEKYLRYWFEVSQSKCGFGLRSHREMTESGLKWFPLTSGGLSRKWYGNYEMVVNLENDGADIRATGLKNFRLKDPRFYFLEGLTWTEVTTRPFTCRYLPGSILFGNGGPVAFFEDDSLFYSMGLLNSVVCRELFSVLAPTMNYGPDQVRNVPYKAGREAECIRLVRENIALSRQDWDAFESSWDFKRHPLTAAETSSLASAWKDWEKQCEERFVRLKANEEALNQIFIDNYGLSAELSAEVKDKDVTVRRADLGREIRSLISYAVGCLFGRYCLDAEGLSYAGGEWDPGRYRRIIPDADNIIPICDDDYFDDDLTARFIAWVEEVYGKPTLEENLRFIADALGGKGAPREVIRSYFLNDFYTDHLKIYQKRPIYWLFDSGKKNGFKALCYMHRYRPDLLARLRTDYVHEMQERCRTQLAHLSEAIEGASGADRVKLTRQQKKVQEQALEIRKYEEKIHHLADRSIRIDPDDGVKYNYALFADVLAKIN